MFVSQAQRAKFYADPRLRKYAAEFEAATPKGAQLPERVGDRKQLAQAVRRHVRRRHAGRPAQR